MAVIKQDIYVLGQSPAKEIESIAEEIRLDLKLQPQPLNSTGKVTGIVTYQGNPLPHALIKIMDSDYEPILHGISGDDGSYTIDGLSAGNSYHVFCSAARKLMKQGSSFGIQASQVITSNFDMEDDPNAQLGIIAGDLYDFSSNKPIGGAVVSLYSADDEGKETLQAITYTNQYGQFVFRELNNGKYFVRISALGYIGTSMQLLINTIGQIAPVKVTMNQDHDASKGTVSGMITDANNTAIEGADVILYLVGENGELTPIAFTKTNASGVYLFIQVPQGKYVVKSNQTQDITVSA